MEDVYSSVLHTEHIIRYHIMNVVNSSIMIKENKICIYGQDSTNPRHQVTMAQNCVQCGIDYFLKSIILICVTFQNSQLVVFHLSFRYQVQLITKWEICSSYINSQ
jgi:hypothetical protein